MKLSYNPEVGDNVNTTLDIPISVKGKM